MKLLYGVYLVIGLNSPLLLLIPLALLSPFVFNLLIRMTILKCTLKFILTAASVVLIVSSCMFIYYMGPYLENEALGNLLGENSWLTKAFVYGVGGFLLILGIIELLACLYESKCLISLVYFSLSLVSIASFCLNTSFRWRLCPSVELRRPTKGPSQRPH